MKFGPVPLADAENAILGHNVADADGRRTFRKGRPLSAEDLVRLGEMGHTVVYAAILEPGDVGEEEAALRVTRALAGDGLRLSGPSTGRVNLYATGLGVVRVDRDALLELNSCDGVTLATRLADTAVAAGRMVATTKILPYALPESVVARAEEIGRLHAPLVAVDLLPARRVGLILSGSSGARQRVEAGFASALEQRLSALGSRLERIDYVCLDEEGGEDRLARLLRQHRREGFELLVLAGETAIQDRQDIAPRAVERAGGEVICFGAPVDPGNLLLLAELDGVPVLGAPGCARSPKTNIVDLVLPRLLVGDCLSRSDIVAFGYGGLLEDVPERPLPRSQV